MDAHYEQVFGGGMMRDKQCLVVLDANYRAGISILRSLDKKVKIICLINKNKSKFSKYVDFLCFYKYTPQNFEFYTEDTIIEDLLRIKKEKGGFFLIPTGESLLRKIIKNKEILGDNNILTTLPSIDIYENLSNKYAFTKICSRYGLRTPKQIKSFPVKFTSPFVVKPRELKNSNKLKTPFLVENKKSFDLLVKMSLDKNDYFIQEYVDGPSIYYCCLYRNKKKITYFTQINLHQQPGGKSVIKAAPYNIPLRIVKKIDKMFINLNFEGVMMFEIKQAKNIEKEEYYAIEINPRFWGPLQLCLDNNINFPLSLLDIKDTTSESHKKSYGYIWFWGYLHGLILRHKTKSSFQINKNITKNFIFKDVWFRRDTLVYFFLEPIQIILSNCLIWIKQLKVRWIK